MPTRIIRTKRDLADLHWYPFPGYEDRYEITKSGQVRSITRLVNSPVAGGARRICGKELKAALVKGYPSIQPNVNGTRKTLYIHRAIATLFVSNPEGKPHVNHIDGDKTNNDPVNLEWVTHAENMRHAMDTGLMSGPVNAPGDRCPSSKLTEAAVAKIKARLINGERQSAIAREYGVSKGAIGFIARGQTWAHVEPSQ